MENFNFEYNFSLLSATALRSNGIKSFSELVEVFEDKDSQFEVLQEDKRPIIAVIGFSKNSIPIKIAFSNVDGTITFFDARKASKQEIIDEFCKFCK